MGFRHRKPALRTEGPILGNVQELSRQLGSPDLMLQDSAALFLHTESIKDVQSLEKFLTKFRDEVLAAVDLPVICRAHQLASANQGVELISFDQEFGKRPQLGKLTLPSREAGKRQLKRMHPLRDHKVVQKYLRAHENGSAAGWHSIVYGLTMAVYAIPLRQALLNYSEKTISVMAESAMFSRQFSVLECQALVEKVLATLPAIVEQVLKEFFTGSIR